jgi:hypothetical protein
LDLEKLIKIELKALADHFCVLNPTLFDNIQKKKNYNIQGSIISLLTTSIEVEVTTAVINFCILKK